MTGLSTNGRGALKEQGIIATAKPMEWIKDQAIRRTTHLQIAGLSDKCLGTSPSMRGNLKRGSTLALLLIVFSVSGAKLPLTAEQSPMPNPAAWEKKCPGMPSLQMEDSRKHDVKFEVCYPKTAVSYEQATIVLRILPETEPLARLEISDLSRKLKRIVSIAPGQPTTKSDHVETVSVRLVDAFRFAKLPPPPNKSMEIRVVAKGLTGKTGTVDLTIAISDSSGK